MIRLASIHADRLNLNGDQGNLLALSKYLRLAGFEVAVGGVQTTQSALESNFVLLGHGSMAAMESVKPTLRALDWKTILKTVPGLAIGSGYEYLASAGLTKDLINRSERESEFQVGHLGKISALGYRNTDSGLSNLTISGQWICSMLHGPVLAKNPILLDRAAKAAVASARLDWPANLPAEFLDWVATLNDLSSRIWSLETQEVFEGLKF